MARRRKLIVAETYTEGKGDSQTFGGRYSLPMGAANAVESENAAVRIQRAVNAQLDFAKSSLRLVLYDVQHRLTPAEAVAWMAEHLAGEETR